MTQTASGSRNARSGKPDSGAVAARSTGGESSAELFAQRTPQQVHGNGR
ncbi:hypothetical protein MMEU_0979 [Mycobacterium marinum str. Europe]|nr:hypothetical protein MMEU_0979 [Mycobacterium marinum str. Europe]